MEEENVNIQEQLAAQEKQPTGQPDISIPGMGGQIDPFDAPTPGESLTKNPEEKYPWERPPQYTDTREFMEDLYLQITEDETYIDLLGSLLRKTPIDEMTQMILHTSMTKGKINPDMVLMLIEPVMYLLIAIAEQAEIEPVIYEGEDADVMSEENEQMYLDESKKLKDMKPKEIKKSSVEPSLLAKVKELPTAQEVNVTDQEIEEELV